ncbi:MAG TPA: type VII secretion protein EccE, partial [Pseudonocardiaceae bacterium]|nr:type VII secretion protein EccE [Pseudonocardiaceae bacterium]
MTTTPSPGTPHPAGEAAPAPRPSQSGTPAGGDRARRRSTGARLGPLPVINLVVLEIGLALGLVLLAINPGLWWAALLVLLIAAPVGLARWRGRWLMLWIQLFARYLVRSHDRHITSVDPVAADSPVPGSGAAVAGANDPRVSLLRLLLPDLVVAHGSDHEREPLGLAWHQGTWTAVLTVDAAPSLISSVGG